MISSPKAPDPYVTADAQTKANTDAAITSGLLNNINERTPYGSVDYTTGPLREFTDASGRVTKIPTQTRTIRLSPTQAKINSINEGNTARLGNLATVQINNLANAIRVPFRASNLPAAAAPVDAPTLDTGRVAAQTLDTSRIAAPQLQGQFADAGEVGRTIADAGAITKTYGGNDFSADRKRVEDAYLARSNDDFARDESAMDQKLRNQGLAPGSAAYNTQFDQLRRQQTDARNQAIVFGGQEQSRLSGLEAARAGFENAAQAQQFGQNADRATFGNAAQAQDFGQKQARGLFLRGADQANFDNAGTSQDRVNAARTDQFNNDLASKSDFNTSAGAQYSYRQAAADAKNAYRKGALEEAYAMRNQPINEALALASGTQVTAPQFTQPFQTGVNSAPIADLIGQDYRARLDASNNRATGLFGLLGQGLSMLPSDRRLKENIKRLGTLADGLHLYRWTWRHDGKPSIGMMADEVLKILPDAVRRIGGVLMVDYRKAIAHAG